MFPPPGPVPVAKVMRLLPSLTASSEEQCMLGNVVLACLIFIETTLVLVIEEGIQRDA